MKKIISVFLLIAMLAACAASAAVVFAAETVKTITLSKDDLTFFYSPNNTTVTYDDTEKAIKLRASGSLSDPYVHFSVLNYASSHKISVPSASDTKYVIFRVRQNFCSTNIFEAFYLSGNIYGATGGRSVSSTFDNSTDEWQYVILNMDGREGWTGTIRGFRIDWELSASQSDEAIYIDSITFASNDEELKSYITPASSGDGDLHAPTAEQKRIAKYLMENAVESAPEVSNEPIKAANEDSSLVMWFDHSYAKTPAEVVKSNGRNTYQMRLAKNEIETCEMVLASAKDMKDLTVEVTDFVNGDSKLTPRVYYGFYFDDVEGETIVDPIPLLESPISLTANKSQLFLIKVKTESDTKPGQYEATLTVKDSAGKEIKKAKVYAYVWDFALPESPTVKTLADLGWWSIYAADSQLFSGDDGLAYRNYYDTLLENGVNAYNMPYVGEAEYTSANSWEREYINGYLNNPRVQAFNPIGFSKDPTYSNVSRAYEYLSQNEEWLKKAYFYTVDEPMTLNALNEVRSDATLIKSIFGDKYKLITPMHWNIQIDREYKVDSFEYLKGYTNIWCPHTFFFNSYADKQANPLLTYRSSKRVEANLGTFAERMAEEQAAGNEVWWYVTRFPHTPEIALSINDKEVDHRLMFWQQKLYNVDGFLYYSVNDWYGAGSSAHNWGWDKKYEVDTGAVNPFIYYGNGVLLYHGGYIGKIHDCVESIRLESIRDGIEDYDYFVLLDEKYGEGTSEAMIKQITTSLGEYKSDNELFAKIRTAVGNLIAGELLEIPQGMAGDVNGDGAVNNKDVIALFRYINKAYKGTVDEIAADANGDGSVNNKDVIILFRHISNPSIEIYYGPKVSPSEPIELPDDRIK